MARVGASQRIKKSIIQPFILKYGKGVDFIFLGRTNKTQPAPF
jgi:hypothetical protein